MIDTIMEVKGVISSIINRNFPNSFLELEEVSEFRDQEFPSILKFNLSSGLEGMKMKILGRDKTVSPQEELEELFWLNKKVEEIRLDIWTGICTFLAKRKFQDMHFIDYGLREFARNGQTLTVSVTHDSRILPDKVTVSFNFHLKR